MMSHIFNCVCALKYVQDEQLQNIPADEKANRRADINVFLSAISSILTISEGDEKGFIDCDAFRMLAQAFPRTDRLQGHGTIDQIGRSSKSWLPLHWATVLSSCAAINGNDSVTEAKKIFTADPDMLHLPHINVPRASSPPPLVAPEELKSLDSLKDVIGCAPCHLLAAMKKPNMELVNYFSLIDPRMAFRHAMDSYATSSRFIPTSPSAEKLEIMESNNSNCGGSDGGPTASEMCCEYSCVSSASSPDLQVLEELCGRDEIGYLPLHMAAIHSDSTELMEFLIQCNPGATRARAGPLARIPLHFLISRPCSKTAASLHAELVFCLMRVDPESALIGDSDGITAFHLVFSRPCADSIEKVVHLMLSLCPAAARVPSPKYSMYPVHLAVSFLNGKLCEKVLPELLGAYKEAAALRDSRGHLAAFLAAQFSTTKVLQLLLEAYPEALTAKDKGGRNLYHRATSRADGDADIVQYLSKNYPDTVKVVDEKGLTPLHFAVYYGKDLNFLNAIYQADPSAIKVKRRTTDCFHTFIEFVVMTSLINNRTTTTTTTTSTTTIPVIA
jgi:ankyrin repeat protein